MSYLQLTFYRLNDTIFKKDRNEQAHYKWKHVLMQTLCVLKMLIAHMHFYNTAHIETVQNLLITMRFFSTYCTHRINARICLQLHEMAEKFGLQPYNFHRTACAD